MEVSFVPLSSPDREVQELWAALDRTMKLIDGCRKQETTGDVYVIGRMDRLLYALHDQILHRDWSVARRDHVASAIEHLMEAIKE